jgi:predicted CXXCH cytochrome family protein
MLLAVLFALPLEPMAAGGLNECLGNPVDSHGQLANSISCLACHDGAAASDVGAGPVNHSRSGLGESHPNMISYQLAYGENPTRFVQPALLDPSIQLLNGEVHCVSCHAVSTNQGWQLVRVKMPTQLCVSCHRK